MITNWAVCLDALLDCGDKMRFYQRQYARYRSEDDLRRARELEKKFDGLVENMRECVRHGGDIPQQQQLF